MEHRVTRLETLHEGVAKDIGDIKGDVRELRNSMHEMRRDMQSDFRVLFGALIIVALGIAGLMAKGFHWL